MLAVADVECQCSVAVRRTWRTGGGHPASWGPLPGPQRACGAPPAREPPDAGDPSPAGPLPARVCPSANPFSRVELAGHDWRHGAARTTQKARTTGANTTDRRRRAFATEFQTTPMSNPALPERPWVTAGRAAFD